MKRVYKILGMCLLLTLAGGATALAQRPRATTDTSSTSSSDASATKPAPAPQTFTAKYEGGVFGYKKKEDGTLSFDDANQRLVFRNKEQKEILSMPYQSLTGAYADSKSQTTTGGKVVKALPLPYGANMAGLLARKKMRYLILQFSDPDTKQSGTTSFQLENKDILASALNTLAEKAGLEARGDGYIRKKDSTTP